MPIESVAREIANAFERQFSFCPSAHRTNQTPKTRQGKEGLYHLVYKLSPTLLSTDNGWDKFRSFPCTLFSPA